VFNDRSGHRAPIPRGGIHTNRHTQPLGTVPFESRRHSRDRWCSARQVFAGRPGLPRGIVAGPPAQGDV
jgi:hypothetical protein